MRLEAFPTGHKLVKRLSSLDMQPLRLTQLLLGRDLLVVELGGLLGKRCLAGIGLVNLVTRRLEFGLNLRVLVK